MHVCPAVQIAGLSVAGHLRLAVQLRMPRATHTAQAHAAAALAEQCDLTTHMQVRDLCNCALSPLSQCCAPGTACIHVHACMLRVKWLYGMCVACPSVYAMLAYIHCQYIQARWAMLPVSVCILN